MTAERVLKLVRRAALLVALLVPASARGAPPCPPLPPQAPSSRAQAEAAYRRAPTPAGLYALALWACREGERAAFADLLRRYEDQTPRPSPEEQQLIRAAWDARAAGVEVTVRAGAQGDALVVDGRLLAVLPLTRALWLSAGTHRLVIEVAPPRGPRLNGRAPGPRVEISCPLDSRKRYYTLQEDGAGLSCGTPLTVLLVAAGERAGRLLRAAQEARLGGLLALTIADVGGTDEPCVDDGCALALGQRADLSYLLTLRARADQGPAARWDVALWDVALQDRGGAWTLECAGCTDDELARRLQRQLPTFLRAALSRGRGALEVTGTPPEATVLLDGRVRGRTPLRAQVYDGPRLVRVEKRGYHPLERRIDVPASGSARVDATLVPTAAPLVPAPRPRLPRWRLGTGAAALLAGAAAAGFGSWGLAIAGDRFLDDCPRGAGPCTWAYDTKPLGIALTTTGAALLLGGALLLAVPMKKTAEPIR